MSTKDNNPSSETFHNSAQREDTRRRRHYPSLFQQRDGSVHYALQSVYVSDRLHLRSYRNSTKHNSRTLIHVILSPPFHTKTMELCAANYAGRKYNNVLVCISLNRKTNRVHKGSGNTGSFCECIFILFSFFLTPFCKL